MQQQLCSLIVTHFRKTEQLQHVLLCGAAGGANERSSCWSLVVHAGLSVLQTSTLRETVLLSDQIQLKLRPSQLFLRPDVCLIRARLVHWLGLSYDPWRGVVQQTLKAPQFGNELLLCSLLSLNSIA